MCERDDSKEDNGTWMKCERGQEFPHTYCASNAQRGQLLQRVLAATAAKTFAQVNLLHFSHRPNTSPTSCKERCHPRPHHQQRSRGEEFRSRPTNPEMCADKLVEFSIRSIRSES